MFRECIQILDVEEGSWKKKYIGSYWHIVCFDNKMQQMMMMSKDEK